METKAASESASLSLRDAVLAVAIVAVWGTNFVIGKMALDVLPPLLFIALRFIFVLFPAVFFLKRPPVSWKNLAGYGSIIGLGQFGLIYIAMKNDITPGLASLVLQVQVIFTIGLSIALRGERVRLFQWLAVALAMLGMAIIMLNAGGTTTMLGLGLSLASALSWAICNLISKEAGSVNMLAYVVWASIFSVPPLVVASLIFEGPHEIAASLHNAGLFTWAAVLWQSVGNTMFGYAAWSWLLSRYPTATVSPMALLVPIFGFGTSAIVLSEPLEPWKLGATALVMGGLALNTFWPMIDAKRVSKPKLA